MSGDIQNWRPLLSSAGTKLNSLRGYLASKDPRPLSSASSHGEGNSPPKPGADLGSATRQSWTQWAGEKLRRSNQSRGDNTNALESVSLFPGWAARRAHQAPSGESTMVYCIRVLFVQPSLNVCCRHLFQCGCLCGRVRFKTQQSGFHVSVAEGISEVGEGYVLLPSSINLCVPTRLQDSLHFRSCRTRPKALLRRLK